MKILYISQYFPPEMGAPSARASELSRYWTAMGHEVTVLTGFPNHPTGVVPPEWRSRFWRLRDTEMVEGTRVERAWLWPLPNRKAHERIRNYWSFFVSSAVRGLGLDRPDVVIGSSPQLLVALAACWVAWWKRVPFVFEVRDLWPESLAAVGLGAEGSMLHSALGEIAGFLYRKADCIAVVTHSFRDHLVQHWHVSEEKIAVVENGVDTDLFRPTLDNGAIRKSLKADGRFVLCYIGTLGMAHGLETVLLAAKQLKESSSQTLILFIGEGAEKARMIQLAREHRLENMIFLDQQRRENIPAYVSAADACLVVLRRSDLFKTVIPTKLLEYMACERPVIVAVDGEARQLVERARAGIYVVPEDSTALARAVIELAEHPETRMSMGRNGRQYVIDHLSRERTARDYIHVLQGVISRMKGTMSA